ncbi:serine hydroxymethyltransferase [candidate division KSB3 bacterium]|uniref:Serine hydroxymethyltransferase n=1 Tax=candidate division KSB3 bacterium TaxID=2044937 RepID=A0A2G6E7D8_9BACT|nr:MAG: serine hydroxymethyltransferase [candidate division KSB3 bacterium]PIE30370.1 MAG: serine hydroxymethyltransferase [candidate division KSB3 bacterium]
MSYKHLQDFDPEVFSLIKAEEQRQQNKLSMIPSENFTLPAVREVLSSVLVHKYAEGQPHKRYYEGNQYIDQLELLCKERAKAAFSLPEDWGVNVQALAGGNANFGVYNGILTPGDRMLSMYLPDGGHLSHGWSFPEKDEAGLEGQVDQDVYFGGRRKVSVVSKIFDVIQYKVNPETRLFDYNHIRDIAKKYQPKILISGGTAYPREIDYQTLADIASEIGAYYLADVSHEAGLIAAGVNASPVGIADVVTFTTHKTLRGPRGAVILAKNGLIQQIDAGIFPGFQGGPFEHCIASIAVCLKDVQSDTFKAYAEQVVLNAKRLAANLLQRGYDVVSGGTDKHLVLVDLRNKGLSGRNPATALDDAGIVANRNSVPNETGSPMNPSGLRFGTPVITTRGMKEAEMDLISAWIDEVITAVQPFSNLKPREFRAKIPEISVIPKVAADIKALCQQFPLNI